MQVHVTFNLNKDISNSTHLNILKKKIYIKAYRIYNISKFENGGIRGSIPFLSLKRLKKKILEEINPPDSFLIKRCTFHHSI